MNCLSPLLVLVALLAAAPVAAQTPPPAPADPPADAQAAAPPPVQPAVPLALALEGPVAMVFHTIKADMGPGFEQLFDRLRTGLEASQDAARRQQISGWRLLKQNASTAEGHLVYVSVIEPVVAGQEYDMARLLAEAYPDEGVALYQALLAAHVQPVVQASSLTAVTAPAPGAQP